MKLPESFLHSILQYPSYFIPHFSHYKIILDFPHSGYRRKISSIFSQSHFAEQDFCSQKRIALRAQPYRIFPPRAKTFNELRETGKHEIHQAGGCNPYASMCNRRNAEKQNLSNGRPLANGQRIIHNVSSGSRAFRDCSLSSRSPCDQGGKINSFSSNRQDVV